MREVAIVRILNSNKTKTRPTNDVLKAAFGALNNIKDALKDVTLFFRIAVDH